MRTLVVGTAGHIDHGKSALVKALTGTDPDRLKEEQERGITIDLGFAHLVEGDAAIAFVDVPGHERFVRNMLAGAGGIDAVVLVVAADDSVKPQTREHFDICRLLGIRHGLVAITKTDLVDEETVELASLDVRELVAGSFLAEAPVIPVSARTGAGLPALSAAIAALAGAPARQARTSVVRLPVDRVFTVKGFGAVVTGTLVSGRVAPGDELVLLPAGRPVRVRGVQVHGEKADFASAPRRVAINLAGIEARELSRGVTLATSGSLVVTRRVDVALQLLPGARPLQHGARVRVYHGTSEVVGRVSIAAVRPAQAGEWIAARPGDAGIAVPSGGTAYARLRLEHPAVLTRGDRLVLRAFSPPVTIGGARVLDPEASSGGVRRQTALERFGRLEDPEASLDVWLAEAGGRGLDAGALIGRGGQGPAAARAALDALVQSARAVEAGGRVFDAALADRIANGVQAALETFHRAQPQDSGMAREALRDKIAARVAVALFDSVLTGLASRGVVTGTDRLALVAHRPARSADDTRVRETVLRRVRDGGLTPPDAAALASSAGVTVQALAPVLHALTRERALVRLDDSLFDPQVLAGLKAEIQALRPAGTGAGSATIDVATFKTKYGLSRKFAIPLLEWLDRERVTRRVGDQRVVL